MVRVHFLLKAIHFLDTFILADEPFEKALRSFETCVLVNNRLRGKLFSSLESPIIFEERFIVTPVRFIIADFNLLSCKLGNLILESPIIFEERFIVTPLPLCRFYLIKLRIR